MAKRRIFTIGFHLPGDEFEYIEPDSNQTLLDADIILFEPTLKGHGTNQIYENKHLLHASSVNQVRHWRDEIIEACNAGKLVIVYLTEPLDRYRLTDQTGYSGAGREKISSYNAVPFVNEWAVKSGKEMRLEKDASYLRPYWTDFSSYSHYQVEIAGDFTHVLLKSRAGNRTVGAAVHSSDGAILFLPPLKYHDEKLFSTDRRVWPQNWTDEGFQFGKRLVATLANLAENLRKSVQSTAPPSWALDSQYRLIEESKLEAAISACASEIAQLQSKKSSLATRLSEVCSLRHLLFEQGPLLESAILEALRLLGFKAQPYSDGESEFDAVFVSPEGRCIGEAEGKDNKAINIDKFSQLERNIQEDFERDDVTEHAKGVLFGNAYRLTPLDARGEYFTAKCLSAAKRVRAALVRTPDLFTPVSYLNDNLGDTAYATRCREAIFRSEGDVVIFPPPPK